MIKYIIKVIFFLFFVFVIVFSFSTILSEIYIILFDPVLSASASGQEKGFVFREAEAVLSRHWGVAGQRKAG